MEYIIGLMAAVAVGLFASVIGFDKDRSFYPVVLTVIGTLYLLFAAMANSTDSLVAEAIPALVFVAMAALGFRKTPWLVVAGLALHGVFDFFHHAVIANRCPCMVAGLVSCLRCRCCCLLSRADFYSEDCACGLIGSPGGLPSRLHHTSRAAD